MPYIKEGNAVDHPSHYNQGGIECIDAMRSAFGDAALIDFCQLNAFKYLWRARNKDGFVQDVKKAVWYANKAIEIAEGNGRKTGSVE